MNYEDFLKVVEDGGGFSKIITLIFDNSLLFIKELGGGCKESDFVKLGNTWFFKEPFVVRDKRTCEYTITLYNYHPLDHLQSVIMGDGDKVDIMSINDMLGH